MSMLATTIAAFLYQEYADDDDLQAFVSAYNTMTQRYVNTFNSLFLPDFTGLSGQLLDWVGAGLYGLSRPTLEFSTSSGGGEFNTWELDGLEFNGTFTSSSTTLYVVTDDIYKRILQWNFFKADGMYFNVWWLKRRVARFLASQNGVPVPIDQTYNVSVEYAPNRVINITIDDSTGVGNVLAAAINEQVCALPFIYTYNVTVVSTVPANALTGADGLFLKGADGLYLTYAV